MTLRDESLSPSNPSVRIDTRTCKPEIISRHPLRFKTSVCTYTYDQAIYLSLRHSNPLHKHILYTLHSEWHYSGLDPSMSTTKPKCQQEKADEVRTSLNNEIDKDEGILHTEGLLTTLNPVSPLIIALAPGQNPSNL